MKIQEIFELAESSKKVPELKLHYQKSTLKKEPLNETKKIVKFLRKIFDKGTIDILEEIVLIAMDSNYLPICWYKLAKGSKDAVLIDHRIVLQILLACSADAFIIAHNHPSTSSLPSKGDVADAHALRHKTDLFDIEYFDDIILTKKDHYSFRDQDLIW